MKLLIAEDDPEQRVLLGRALRQWGYDVAEATDGGHAWDLLRAPDSPPIAIIDWEMPVLEGLELCRRVRATPATSGKYLIVLTARNREEDVVAGFEAGANDYITKPFNRNIVRARVQAAARVIELQERLEEQVRELQAALAEVKTLQGILPICSYCKKIRGDQNYWQQVEAYVSHHSQAQFSHSICPDCWQSKVVEEYGCDLPYDPE